MIGKKALLFKKANGNIQCTACRHYCKISPGKTGICGVRLNEKGELFSLVYGRPVSVNIDPVEKKPMFHFLPGTTAFSVGTLGCNLKCAFCQNWEISQATKDKPAEKIIETIDLYSKNIQPEEIVKQALESKCSSVAYTYNEPTIFIEYAYDTAKLAAKEGLKNIFVTSGYESLEALKKIKPYLDAVNIDLKSFNAIFYSKVCGAKLEHILENIKEFHKHGIWTEITTLVIPGKNDSKKELVQIAEFIANIDKEMPWHVSRFFPHHKMMDVKPTPIEKLLEAYNIGKTTGLRHVYVGNVPDASHESTYCPKCKNVVIKRTGYIIENNLKSGACNICGETIKGIWK